MTARLENSNDGKSSRSHNTVAGGGSWDGGTGGNSRGRASGVAAGSVGGGRDRAGCGASGAGRVGGARRRLAGGGGRCRSGGRGGAGGAGAGRAGGDGAGTGRVLDIRVRRDGLVQRVVDGLGEVLGNILERIGDLGDKGGGELLRAVADLGELVVDDGGDAGGDKGLLLGDGVLGRGLDELAEILDGLREGESVGLREHAGARDGGVGGSEDLYQVRGGGLQAGDLAGAGEVLHGSVELRGGVADLGNSGADCGSITLDKRGALGDRAADAGGDGSAGEESVEELHYCAGGLTSVFGFETENTTMQTMQ